MRAFSISELTNRSRSGLPVLYLHILIAFQILTSFFHSYMTKLQSRLKLENDLSEIETPLFIFCFYPEMCSV